MTTSRFGTATKAGELHVLRYERRLGHPVDDVWAAITEPARIVEWLAAADELDLRERGTIVLRWQNVPDDIGEWDEHGVELDGSDPAAPVRGTVTRLDAPRLLELETDTMGVLRFELEPDGDATRLVFTNEVALPEAFPAEQTLAGWHVHLDMLERALDGHPADWARWTEDHMAGWEAIRDRYAAAERA